MKKYISVPNHTKVELRTIFSCTKEMVWMALNFKSDSDLAQRIRKLALAKGGVIFDESKQVDIPIKLTPSRRGKLTPLS